MIYPGLSGRPRHLINASPPALFALVLLGEPAIERREIVGDGAGVEIALAGEGFKRIGPGFRGAHLQHRLEALADLLVAVDRAAMERPAPAGDAAGRAVEL